LCWVIAPLDPTYIFGGVNPTYSAASAFAGSHSTVVRRM
jgi:hypothetical protein